jgi:hypothetical protein
MSKKRSPTLDELVKNMLAKGYHVRLELVPLDGSLNVWNRQRLSCQKEKKSSQKKN